MHSQPKANPVRLRRKFPGVCSCLFVAGLLAATACQTYWPEAAPQAPTMMLSEQDTPGPSDAAQDRSDLVIEEAALPNAFLRTPYEFRFRGHGGVPPLHWRLASGVLPPGISLTEQGELRGTPEREGEFRFTAALSDNEVPPQGVQRAFVLRVVAGMSLQWKTLAHVTGNRIDGLAQVTNITPDDMDLTFDAKAVAENGRATEIGYQHFSLKRGTVDMEIPFGENLPRGAYKIYLLAVGEVAAKKLIYKQQLEVPGRLAVTLGP
jgi:hypothetical protein